MAVRLKIHLVTPFVGVWIETESIGLAYQLALVTPFVGVWIETLHKLRCYPAQRQSHPSWVCGLKLNIVNTVFSNLLSHPSWVCGLKPYIK